MRIITGTARGRKLLTPENYEIRPTAENVKEAIFSSIHFELSGATFLDLFAGTAQMGLEALSRGAEKAVFVDNDTSAIKIIRKNIENTGFSNKAEVFAMPYSAFLKSTTMKFDIAFIDPPYEKKIMQKALSNIANVMNDDGIIICEHETSLSTMPNSIENFQLVKTYKYGATSISVYKNQGVVT